jgi:hypothetical protein
VETLPAFSGLGTDTVTTEALANFDTSGPTPVIEAPTLAGEPNPEFGTEEVLTNAYSNPIFTDTSTDVLSATGALDTTGVIGTETDTILLDPSSGLDFGISLESVPGVGTDAAPTVTEDLITPFGSFPLGDLGGGDLTSLLGGGDGLGSLLTGGDLLTGLDPIVSLLTSF